MMEKYFKTRNSAETQAFARIFATTLRGGDVVGLVGELGAGKTTFVQGFAKAFGMRRAVRSPTFLRMQVYKIKDQKSKIKIFVHVDAYHIKKPQQLLEFGLEDYLGKKDAIVVIEWADRIKKILPKETQWIRFQHGKDENERRITLPRGRPLQARSSRRALSKSRLGAS